MVPSGRAIAWLALSLCLARAANPDTYFLFVRSWSPTFCTTSRSADPGACASASNRFTIHGLWLTCTNGGWPDEAECPGTAWDPQGISDLGNALDQQWPSYGDKGNEAFWQHEWECHGICAGVEDSALASESAFFGTVLQLDSQYPLNNLAASFQLDTPQALSDIEAAATSALGARPIITCDHQRGTAYLDSVFACVSDSLQPVDCGPSSEECRSRTVTVPSLSSLQSLTASNGTSHARALRSSNAKGCSRSRIQCEP